MFCGECGTRNPDTGEMCTHCGKPLRKSQQLVQSAPSAESTRPAVQPAAAAPRAKRKWNWIGIGSLILGILSLAILTTLLALVAIILGVFSLYTTRKETGKIAFSAIAGIVIAGAALGVSLLIP